MKNDLLEKIFPFKNKGTGKKYGSVSRSGRWELLIDKKYFGNPIKSALVIGIGEGKHRVEWHTSLPVMEIRGALLLLSGEKTIIVINLQIKSLVVMNL